MWCVAFHVKYSWSWNLQGPSEYSGTENVYLTKTGKKLCRVQNLYTQTFSATFHLDMYIMGFVAYFSYALFSQLQIKSCQKRI